MSGDKEVAVAAIASLQTAINGLGAGAPKTAVQAAFDTMIVRLARTQALGELRVGRELPAAS